jgi:hypothetical protein
VGSHEIIPGVRRVLESWLGVKKNSGKLKIIVEEWDGLNNQGCD